MISAVPYDTQTVIDPLRPTVQSVDNLVESDDLGFGDFAALYRRAVVRSGKTQDAIAKAIGYKNQGFLSLMLTRDPRGNVPVERLADWLAPLDLSSDEYATMYRKGREQYAPEYVRELISNFAQFHALVMKGGDGATLPSLDQVLSGQLRHRA